MDATLYRGGFPTPLGGESYRLTYQWGSRLAKVGRYEPEITEPFTRTLRPGMTVLDVGAHVGVLTLMAAYRVGPSGRVVAFEPSPDTLRALRKHVRVNGFDDRVTVEPLVASDRAGELTFFTYRDSMAASLSRDNVEQLNAQHPDHATPVTVPAVTLDGYCAEHRLVPDLIKIDVEGAELRVLAGTRGLLEAARPTVFCEVHPLQMGNLGGSVEALQAFVRDVGYEIVPLAPAGYMGIVQVRLSPR